LHTDRIKLVGESERLLAAGDGQRKTNRIVVPNRQLLSSEAKGVQTRANEILSGLQHNLNAILSKFKSSAIHVFDGETLLLQNNAGHRSEGLEFGDGQYLLSL
jgi:hypothetical protein